MARRWIFGVVVLAVLAGAIYLAVRARGGGETAEPAGREPAAEEPTDLVPDAEIVDVLSPDAIPAIDEPSFVTARQASDWLAEREPVVALELDGDARAYPVQILMWHEIVNDEVAGRPVTVSFCPLCNSAVGFDRNVDGQILDFGTSGKLHKSALVMYDRQTNSLWLHFEGSAIQGPLTGTQLEFIPLQLLSFGQWRSQFPDGQVLSRETGFTRPYGENPYEYYDSKDGPYQSFFTGPIDKELHPMERVVGVAFGDDATAYPFAQLGRGDTAGVVHDTVGGNDIVVFWQAGAASALDQPRISNGQDVGASGVFVPQADGRRLTFEVRDGSFLDTETGTRWSLTGEGVEGPLAGESLKRVHHLDSFWFAWWSHHPEGEVYGA